MGLQTLIHHIIGTSGMLIGVLAGYGTAGIANLTVLSEMSTIFLNYRSMYTKEQLSDLVPQINQITFFVLYTVFRMILYPYGIYVLVKMQYYSWDYNTQMRRQFLFITIFEYVAMFALNIYWYKLILVGLLKMFGVIESKSKKKVEAGNKME